MTAAIQFLLQIRDEANINMAAVNSVREQLKQRSEELAAFPASDLKRSMTRRISMATLGMTALCNQLLALRTGAHTAAGSLDADIPPISTPQPNSNGGGTQWSTNAW